MRSRSSATLPRKWLAEEQHRTLWKDLERAIACDVVRVRSGRDDAGHRPAAQRQAVDAVRAREFQAQYTDSVRQNTTNVFINSYQSADLLIVDDIQEWINAPKTLETFFHIFNHLVSCGRQIILVCDRPPLNLYGMNERMLTRFGCGLVAELEKPDMQLCIDILKAKCRNNGLEIPDDITEFVAKSANGNVYVLEGMLNSLKAYSLIDNSTIDMNLAERVTACCTCV